jgi:hypothetical protein
MRDAAANVCAARTNGDVPGTQTRAEISHSDA